MVRVKAKKAKGDEAFTKRTQKVGRKKLAPVTATKADVHARTLRISTSSSLAAAAGALGPDQKATSQSPHIITPGSKRPRDHGAEKNFDVSLAVVTAHSFTELLAGTRHYKGSQRASAFAAMAKLLVMQAEADAEAAARGAAMSGGAYVVLPSSHTETTANTTTAPAVLTGIKPLEKLKCFSAALEAMTDTDDQARRAALHGLRTILTQTDFFVTSSRTAGGAEEDEEGRGIVANGERAAEEEGNTEHDHSGQLGSTGSATTTTVQLDHVVAVLQAIHVSLTHAMKPVRLSGVELLGLLLATAPHTAVRAAARVVHRQQQAYLNTTTAAPLIGTIGMGTAGANASSSSAATPAATTTAPTTTLASSQDASYAEEEAWILTLVRRVSALVLRTDLVPVLAELLDTFLNPQSLLAELEEASFHTAATATAASTTMGSGSATGWHHPELVKDLFDELLPKWANMWKELMEMRLQLLRQESKLLMAAALAQCFATVLIFLKAQSTRVQRFSHAQRGVAPGGGEPVRRTSPAHLFSRQLVQYTRELLIQRIPVTLGEVLRQDGEDEEEVEEGSRSTFASQTEQPQRAGIARQSSRRNKADGAVFASSSSSQIASTLLPMKVNEYKRGTRRTAATTSPDKPDPRLQLALALARVAVPLATTEDGWKLLHHFLSVVFDYDSHRSSEPRVAAAAAGGGGEAHKTPYQFTNARDLLSCLQTLRLALQLYPAPAHTQLWSGSGGSDGGEKQGTTKNGSGASSALAPQEFQQLAVLRKLIPFVPSALQTVTREVGKVVRPVRSPAINANSKRSTANKAADALAIEDAIVTRQLALVAEMMRCMVTFPIQASTNDSSTAGAATSPPPSSGSVKMERVLRGAVEQSCLLLPRLLFALRWQRKEVTSVVNAAGSTLATARAHSDEEERAKKSHTAAVMTKRIQRVGVLPRSHGALDRIVRQLLLCVWSVSSSGHPLMTISSTTGPSAAATAPSFPTQWRNALFSLYGLCKPDGVVVAEGVLARCTPATIAVARDALIYLGVSESEKLTVHKLDWDNAENEWSTATASTQNNTSSGYAIEDMLAMLPA